MGEVRNTSIIEWHILAYDPAPDSIEVIFVTKGENWHIGTWDSDHNHYTDQHSQDICDPVIWAYLPKIPMIFSIQGIATDEAAIALLKIKKRTEH